MKIKFLNSIYGGNHQWEKAEVVFVGKWLLFKDNNA